MRGARDPASVTGGGPNSAKLMPVKLDVTSASDIAAAARACPDVTLLINNAGILLSSPAMAENAVEALRQEMEVNVYGLMNVSQAFAPVIARRGGGAIVNMLSVVSWFTNPATATYCASKHAALAVSDGMRIQLRAHGIQVTAVYAGFIDTDMTAGLSAELKDNMLGHIPLKRFGKAEDVAAAVRFLTSDEAGYITGHVLDVNGGMYM